MMMNSNFIVAQSVRFARRLEAEAGDDLNSQLRLAWQLAYGTRPDETTITEAAGFVSQQTDLFIDQAVAADKKKPADDAARAAQREQAAGQALGVFCQSLLASNQFLYID